MTTPPPRRTRAAGVLVAITMTALLAACSSGSSDHSGGSSADVASRSESASSGTDVDAGSGNDSSAAEDTAGGSVAAPEERAAGPDGGSDAAGGPTTPDMGRAVISSGTVSLSSKDVAATRRDVQRVVDAQGGEVTDESTETDDEGEASYARLVVRVPSARFGEAMEALEQAGGLVSSTRGSDDVTTEVIDTDVRVRAQEASLVRVERLLAEASSLRQIIWIESQLTRRQGELDSLKSQQSWLRDQTSLSTITVDISARAVAEEEPEDEPAGFVTGLREGTSALGSTLATLATVVGVLLPFAALALLVGLPMWLVVRRRRAAATPRTAAPPVA